MEDSRTHVPWWARGPRIVVACFSGLVGIGKSTLIKRLRKTGFLRDALPANVHVSFLREPSHEWQKKGWLGRFYADRSHNAAAFQLQVFCSYVAAVEEHLKTEKVPTHCDTHVVIIERSMHCQRMFWTLQREDGMKTADDNYNEAYVMVWKRWLDFIPPVNILFMFKTADINTTMRRVQARARAEELGASLSSAEDQPLNASCVALATADAPPIQEVGGFTLAYQERLQRLHLSWLTEPRAYPLDGPAEGIACVHIDADAPFHVDDGSLQTLATLMARHIMAQIPK